jgi:hypothetical protein
MQKGHIYVGFNCLCVQWLLTQRTSSASGESVIVQEEEREGEEGRGGERERSFCFTNSLRATPQEPFSLRVITGFLPAGDMDPREHIMVLH